MILPESVFVVRIHMNNNIHYFLDFVKQALLHFFGDTVALAH